MSPALPISHNTNKTSWLLLTMLVSVSGFSVEQATLQESQVSDRLGSIAMESVSLETFSNST